MRLYTRERLTKLCKEVDSADEGGDRCGWIADKIREILVEEQEQEDFRLLLHRALDTGAFENERSIGLVFSLSRPTVKRWLAGLTVPLKPMRKTVTRILTKAIEDHESTNQPSP